MMSMVWQICRVAEPQWYWPGLGCGLLDLVVFNFSSECVTVTEPAMYGSRIDRSPGYIRPIGFHEIREAVDVELLHRLTLRIILCDYHNAT